MADHISDYNYLFSHDMNFSAFDYYATLDEYIYLNCSEDSLKIHPCEGLNENCLPIENPYDLYYPWKVSVFIIVY